VGCPGTDSTQPVGGSASGTPTEVQGDLGSSGGSTGAVDSAIPSEAGAAGDDSGTPPVEPSAEETIEVLRPRVVRRCCRNLAVALLRVEGGVAHVAVTSGQVSFRAQLAAGDRLRLATASEFEVLSVEREGARVRWISHVDDALGEIDVLRVAAPDDGAVILEEMGIYTVGPLTLGVGNVRALKDGAFAVTITVFPKGYQANPMQDWDVHGDVLAGEVRKGAVRTLVVEDVGERTRRPGWVRLGWAR
jgi:hypothetical protein